MSTQILEEEVLEQVEIDALDQLKDEALSQANDIRSALVKYVSYGPREKGQHGERLRFCDSCTQYWVSPTAREFDEGYPSVEDCPQCARLTEWPKGKLNLDCEANPVTPLEALLGLPTYDCGDYWWIATSNSDALHVANLVRHCDVRDEVNARVLTAHQAALRLDDDELAQHERFGVVSNEVLSLFLTSWMAGMFPELEA